MTTGLESRRVVEIRVDGTSYEDAAGRIVQWARAGEHRYVCACNVHMVMEAHDDPAFRDVVNGADIVTADGMPLVWALRLQGIRDARRVYGPDLMLATCAAAARDGIPVGLYGGAVPVLDRVADRLRERFPGLAIPYAFSPAFDDPGRNDAEEIPAIQRSGARILFVALGCPKQERWMAKNRDFVPAVMIGVGAAFDFMAGAKRQAPPFLQAVGLEWAFRLATEPRRLWRRYLVHNPRFVALLARQWLRR